MSETQARSETDVDPDAFVRWTFARALAHRQPLYAAMARRWGIKVAADAIARVQNAEDFEQLIAQALAKAQEDEGLEALAKPVTKT